MRNEDINLNGLGSLDFASLTKDELGMLKQIEDKINANRQEKVVVMALTKQDIK